MADDEKLKSDAGSGPMTTPGSQKTTTMNSEVEKKDDEENKEREGFDNGIEFVLTCLGLAVGLGNIWRFPTRAYANGGSAFLIPYITCAICFGLPVVYLEFLAGQHAGVSPPLVFRRIRPVLEGVGWMGAIVAASVAIYYIVIISWICIYLFNIFLGHLSIWNTCENAWNDRTTCIDMLAQKLCKDIDLGNATKLVYINGSCEDANDFSGVKLLSATEQYFQSNIVRPSKSLFDINGINYPILISMTFCWVLTGLLILKGVKIMGKVSYVTVILPYVIVLILFFRGITLDGAGDGLYFYLGKPDFSKVFSPKTWTEALKQLCFSLSVGHGALMSLSSYSKKRNNCFKDALIVIIGDTMMSLVGGVAVFSTLGFLAKQRGVGVPDVVESGFALTFVVYPEAMTQMPVSWLWSFLFFFMLFLLGISSEIALVEVGCTCLYDRFPSLRRKKMLVVVVWCLILFCCGFIFSTDAGVHWLTLFDEYSSGFSSVCTAVAELLVLMYVYKAVNFRADIVDMLGEARNSVTQYIGPLSPYFTINWMCISPLIGAVLIGLSFIRDYPHEGKPDVYPLFFDIFGWSIALLPPLMVPIIGVLNYLQFQRDGYPPSAIFTIQKQHASYKRIVGEMEPEKREELDALLPDKEPWAVDADETIEKGTGGGGTPTETIPASGSPEITATVKL